jgi:hypothetical protein
VKAIKKCARPLCALATGVLLTELVLTLAGIVSPRVKYFLDPPWKRATEPDAVLGYRMSPYYPGNDRQGFRNSSVPDRCDILAVGASSTYGFAAPAEKAWPRQLEALTGRSVYNMSCGGYGPIEFGVLLDRGLRLRPKLVLVEVYPANDFLDAYRDVNVDGLSAEYRTKDAALLRRVQAADDKATLRSAMARFEEAEKPADHSLRRWLSEHSSLYGLGREVLQTLDRTRYRSTLREDHHSSDRFDTAAARPFRLAFDGVRELRTVFQAPEYGALAVDLTDPRIAEGKTIAEAVYLKMNAATKAASAELSVVVIPSKSLTYRDILRAHSATVPESYFKVVQLEENATAAFEEFLKQNGIAFVDVTLPLRAKLAAGQPVYPETDDVHLNGDGYEVLALAIRDFLTRSRPLP